MIQVSVIYVNWNCAEEILASVDSVKRWTSGGLDHEIIVVDNDSRETIEPLRRPEIKLIRNAYNAGFGAGCNLGAQAARGDFLFFLNPDTRLQNDVLGLLTNFLRARSEAGAVGPMILEEGGRIHFRAVRNLPSLFNEFLEHTTLTFKFPRNRLTGRPYYSYWDHQSQREVKALLGAAMFFRRRVFEEIGGFDPRFFLYYEEVDLCKRTWDAGHKIYYFPQARLMHKSKQSTLKLYGHVDKMIYTYFQSARKYFHKHFGPAYAALWRITVSSIYFWRGVLKHNPLFLDYARHVWRL
ncbi:MAG: glycosyltransferase family 2 protein [Thermodesulfobacteriota bacterium]